MACRPTCCRTTRGSASVVVSELFAITRRVPTVCIGARTNLVLKCVVVRVLSTSREYNLLLVRSPHRICLPIRKRVRYGAVSVLPRGQHAPVVRRRTPERRSEARCRAKGGRCGPSRSSWKTAFAVCAIEPGSFSSTCGPCSIGLAVQLWIRSCVSSSMTPSFRRNLVIVLSVFSCSAFGFAVCGAISRRS